MAKKSKSTPEEKARHLWACGVRRMTDDQIYDTYHDAEKSLEDCQKVAAKALEEAAALQERNKALHDQISVLKAKGEESSKETDKAPETSKFDLKKGLLTWIDEQAGLTRGIGQVVKDRLKDRVEAIPDCDLERMFK